MSADNGAYRWWENYLVRYLMPSIAGAMIVNWLATIGGEKLKKALLIDTGSGQSLQSPTLVVLFLLGNLFCYVASYPVLGFHVTRVVDSDHKVWRRFAFDGYIITGVLAVLVLLGTALCGGTSIASKSLPFALAITFSLAQFYRLYLGFERVTFDGVTGSVSKMYAYTYTLARRRGVAEETKTTKHSSPNAPAGTSQQGTSSAVESFKKSTWRREFMDSYRHMREHGNSAFIFVLELVLAGLCYLVLSTFADKDQTYQLAAIAVLLAVWALPAVFSHLVGQHIERRFSWYERRVSPAADVAQNEP